MSADIDYSAIEVPEDEDPSEYSWQARRAEILQLLEQAGHPRLLNQSRLAERYGCTRQNIHNDFNKLADHVEENLGRRRELITEHVFHRAIEGLLEDGEYRAAAQTVKDWNEWMDDHQALKELEERIDKIAQTQERAKYR